MADAINIDPRKLSRVIKHTSAEQLGAVLGAPTLRRTLPDRIFSQLASQFCPAA